MTPLTVPGSITEEDLLGILLRAHIWCDNSAMELSRLLVCKEIKQKAAIRVEIANLKTRMQHIRDWRTHIQDNRKSQNQDATDVARVLDPVRGLLS